MVTSPLDLSVVIACYNEERILSYSVEELLAVLRGMRLSFELIFVDDASRDATLSVIEACRQRYPEIPMRVIRHAENMGRGKTVSDGFRAAVGRIIGYFDIDLEVHARYIPSMVDAIDRGGADVAVAWRIYKLTWSGLLRAGCSKGYRWLVRRSLGVSLKDTETGFKFFRREALERVLGLTRHPGWFWDTEIMAYCARAELKIAEIPCLFIRRADKVSSVRIVRDSVEYARALWRFRREFLSQPAQAEMRLPEALSSIAAKLPDV